LSGVALWRVAFHGHDALGGGAGALMARAPSPDPQLVRAQLTRHVAAFSAPLQADHLRNRARAVPGPRRADRS
jgi:hypothetical protein